MLELNRQVSAGLPLTLAETEAWRRWILLPPRRRKRKKRRKKKLPRTSSNSSCGRVRRRQRQRHARNAGFPGDVTIRAVFPSVVVRPEIIGIMAVMDQKQLLASLSPGSGTCKARFAGILHLSLCSSGGSCRQARR